MGTDLRLLVLVFGFLLLASAGAQAAAPSWQVKPSVCVNKMLGASCEFHIKIFTANLPQGQYCLYQQQQQLRCMANSAFPVKLAVSLEGQSSLLLKNPQGQVILSHILSVKSLVGAKHRRRLRSPWSLF